MVVGSIYNIIIINPETTVKIDFSQFTVTNLKSFKMFLRQLSIVIFEKWLLRYFQETFRITTDRKNCRKYVQIYLGIYYIYIV